MSERAASSDHDSLHAVDSGMLRNVESLEEGSSQLLERIKDDDGSIILPKGDSNAVTALRFSFFLLLSSIAIGSSILTYHVFSAQQYYRFETQFLDFGTSIVSSFYHATSNKIWAANIMSSVLTSYFQGQDTIHPNMSFPDFSIVAVAARTLSNASEITFSPLIYNTRDLKIWETFASMEKSTSILNQGQAIPNTFHYNRTLQDGVYGYNENGEPINYRGNPPYAPIWKISPRQNNSASIMYNQMDQKARKSALRNLMNEGGSIFSRIIYEEADQSPPHVRGDDTPRGIVYYPVADTFATRRAIGAIGLEFEWENYFDRDFTNHFHGIVFVLESTVGQFTFQIELNGDVKFLGKGDLHDAEFDTLKVDSAYETMHQFCHYGFMNLYEKFSVGRHRDLQQQSAIPIIPLGPTETSFELEGNHTIHYRIHVFPSQAFKEKYVTHEPKLLAIAVAAIFVFTSFVFIVYDRMMEKRQNHTMEAAILANKVVNSQFPAIVRDRLFENIKRNKENRHQAKVIVNQEKSKTAVDLPSETGDAITMIKRAPPHRSRISTFLNKHNLIHEAEQVNNSYNGDEDDPMFPPIADLFPHTSVLFADIVGFTAWSSEREPTQVFQLLETLYRKFDKLALKHGVFKVETIGDCYVAVTGLPEATKDHALIMCRFAWKMKMQMIDACKKLEAILGPGTADLCLRIGIHSGPVTAGVLRGDKSRFQLFGDTMNTASRIESTSLPNQIQLSHTTADLLSKAGKQHWLAKRSTTVEAKGKGSLQTFWLQHINHSMTSDTPPSDVSSSARQSSMNFSTSSNSVNSNEDVTTCPQQFSSSLMNVHENQHSYHSVNTKSSPHQVGRMIQWNFEILYQSLEKIVRMRCMLTPKSSGDDLKKDTCTFPQVKRCKASMMHPIQEIPDVVELCEHEVTDTRIAEPVEFSENIRQQLRDFIWKISTLYRNNPFHNFDHASHVLMSANKLLNRIVSEKVKFTRNSSTNLIDDINNFSFRISCDPLAQFAILFSALIHDVDHTGITNSQLVKESADIALRYNGQSVAEQNSLTVAWNTLLEAQFEDLFITLFPTDIEEKRFRQLITTIVLATDIMDATLKQRRDQRWDAVFSAMTVDQPNDQNIRNQKATIIMEYIMQASDIAHTMQHWHVYCKWNHKLFEEKYKAYLEGHEENDPSINWYDNEILFFDKYIIPLAMKLKECGVFGVCSDEYIGFVMDNRMEWEMKGQDVVKSMLLDAKMNFGRIGKKAGSLQTIGSEG